MRRVITVLLLLPVILLSGCSVFGRSTKIDWVDFIKFKDITYVSRYSSTTLDPSCLDKEYASVTHMLAGHVFDGHYKSRNGDAAFLEKGTPIYRIKGYSPSFRLAAYRDGKIIIYEVDRNPKAQKGKDLLDINDKVKYISIISGIDGTTELGKIENRALIEKVVDMILEAPVANFYFGNEQAYLLYFKLNDGTDTRKFYLIDSARMQPGIQLPKEFGEEINKALKRRDYIYPTPTVNPNFPILD